MKIIIVSGSDQPETMSRFKRKIQSIKMCCGHYASTRSLKKAEHKGLKESNPGVSMILMCSCCRRYVTRPIDATQNHWDQLLVTQAHGLIEVCRAIKRFPLKQ